LGEFERAVEEKGFGEDEAARGCGGREEEGFALHRERRWLRQVGEAIEAIARPMIIAQLAAAVDMALSSTGA